MAEGRDPVFQDLEDQAYSLLFREKASPEAALAVLKRGDAEPALCEMAIESAYGVRHEQALRGDLEWIDWLGAIIRDPARSGVGVKVLVAISVLATLLGVVVTVRLFPSGTYPRIVLMIPGIGFGVVVFAIASMPLYSVLHRGDGNRLPTRETD